MNRNDMSWSQIVATGLICLFAGFAYSCWAGHGPVVAMPRTERRPDVVVDPDTMKEHHPALSKDSPRSATETSRPREAGSAPSMPRETGRSSVSSEKPGSANSPTEAESLASAENFKSQFQAKLKDARENWPRGFFLRWSANPGEPMGVYIADEASYDVVVVPPSDGRPSGVRLTVHRADPSKDVGKTFYPGDAFKIMAIRSGYAPGQKRRLSSTPAAPPDPLLQGAEEVRSY